MNSTKRFKYHQPSVFDEFFETSNQKKIVEQYRVTFVKLLPSSVEIKIDVEVFYELGYRISISVRFLLDDLYQILQGTSPRSVDDDCGCEVSQNVRAHRLNGVQVAENEEIASEIL